MATMRLYLHAVELDDGIWLCQRGRTEVDHHGELSEALGHLAAIAEVNGGRDAFTLIAHHLDGTIQSRPAADVQPRPGRPAPPLLRFPPGPMGAAPSWALVAAMVFMATPQGGGGRCRPPSHYVARNVPSSGPHRPGRGNPTASDLLGAGQQDLGPYAMGAALG